MGRWHLGQQSCSVLRTLSYWHLQLWERRVDQVSAFFFFLHIFFITVETVSICFQDIKQTDDFSPLAEVCFTAYGLRGWLLMAKFWKYYIGPVSHVVGRNIGHKCPFLKDMSQEAEASQQSTVVISTTHRPSHCKDLNGLQSKTTRTNQESRGNWKSVACLNLADENWSKTPSLTHLFSSL